MCVWELVRRLRGRKAASDAENFTENEGSTGRMVLIIGLGNPGSKYAGTRHNIGFSAVTALADECGIALKTKECKGITGTGTIEGVKVKLVQPQTFMNNSGECVRALMDYLADGHFRRDFPGLAPGQVPVAAFRLDEMRAALETLEITA